MVIIILLIMRGNSSSELIRQNKDLNTEGNKSEPDQDRTAGCLELFRFADKYDYILMGVGTLAAAGMGAGLPLFALLWGNITDAFQTGGQVMVDAAKEIFYQFLYIGAGIFVAGVLMFACWMIAGERQAIKCRKEYLKSLLRQEIGWFDMINQTQLSSRFATDSFAYQGAIGEKVSTLVMSLGTFVAGFTIAYVKGWEMALVMMSTIPALGLSGYFYMSTIQNSDKQLQKDYSEAAGKAQQAISGVKTVKMLNGEQFETNTYTQCIEKATKNTLKYGLLMGMGIGSLFLIMLSTYALGFWWGSVLVERDIGNTNRRYTAGNVLVVFFSVIIAGFNMTQLTPAITKIVQGKAAAGRIFKIIDRQPKIFNSANAIRPQNFKGEIRFENVKFSYPKDPSRVILDRVNLQFNANSSAIVGESGCGKSTIIQLIMRFYDPDEGRVTLDGIDIKDIQLSWLRENIGYVGQEPVLFATTIRENLIFGKDTATEQDIIEALKKSQAYDFIQKLQNKLQTYVGYGGGQLSGGQKQRIAIARALLKKPKILLLDEATSALDRTNEKKIQLTLDKVCRESTSITIAHRIKTIMNSDKIYVMDKGRVVESGKFRELSKYKNQDLEAENEDEIVEEKLMKRKSSKVISNVNKIVKGKIDMFFHTEEEEEEQQNDKRKEQQLALSKEQRIKKQQQELLGKYDKQIFARILAYSSDKIGWLIVGTLGSLGNGVIFPIFSIFLSSMITVLLNFSSDAVQSRKDANRYTLTFFILGIAMFIGMTFQITMFNVLGASITKKIRRQTYSKILRMPVKWFDLPKNNAGTLTTRLSTDCLLVNGLTTSNVGISLQNISTLVTAIIIAFIYEWRVALIALGIMPIMIASGVIQMKFTMGFSDKTDQAYKDSSNLITEAMVNIRTVTSFGYDSFVMNQYSKKLEKPYSLAIRKGLISGILFGVSQFTLFLIFGLMFFLGALVVRDNYQGDNFFDGVTRMFTAIYAIVFGAMTAGNNAHFMPDVAAAKNAAANIFLIQDSQDQNQMQQKEESKMIKTGIPGDIKLENVSFRYDSRNQDVFSHLSLKVKEGSKVGFVGISGCGKSTVLQLLLRFYEPYEGKITINNIDIKQFDIHYLRSCFGVVSQEPVLFNQSFKNNIKYNMEATDQQIQQAAIKADAIAFIVGDEKIEMAKVVEQNENKEENNEQKHYIGSGFDRGVGVKGSHISGGQKQRVAIARSILRKPKILLLDEATSALDSINEKKVQNSLDMIMKDKTTISIAHRLETIKNSDQIMVFEKGKIVQSGNYDTLISKKGYFYNLERGTQFI